MRACFFQMSQQSVSLMDIFTTVLNLANLEPPGDRIIDGINLMPVFLENKHIDRLVCTNAIYMSLSIPVTVIIIHCLVFFLGQSSTTAVMK